MIDERGKNAFPTVYRDVQKGLDGMTLRQWYAGMALAGMGAIDNHEEAAMNAFLMADAMLRQGE